MTICENVAAVQARIADACRKAGRDPASVTLIAVSKTHPPEDVLTALACGLQHFGENRVEESSIKLPAVSARTEAPLTWHMIGHLQSRKARDAAALFDWVHSVDTVRLANKLSTAVADLRPERSMQVFLEVNVSGEASKSGFDAAEWASSTAQQRELVQSVQQILALPGLNVRGLMTMAPVVEDAEQARPVFSSLRRLRDFLVAETGCPLSDLSMGMTDDYPVAIEEGATFVRVGRAIFGERIYT
jgi:pyridoxal phosphate enzyme (YggS family)